MLSALIQALKVVIEQGDKKETQRCLQSLRRVGMDETTARMMIKSI
jgi:hypothetical protein